MRFEPLKSSSKGNVYIISDDHTSILLECGVSYKELQTMTDFQLSKFDGCIISHEHGDHSKAAKQLIQSGMDVYMSYGTAEALELPDAVFEMAKEMIAGQQFSIGTIDVMPFGTFHDAKEPLGFLMQSRIDNDIFAFATDTVNIPYNFPNVNLLALEANFEQERLDLCQKLPENKRHRISNTHMEINMLCRCLQRMDLSKCRELYLLHLSDATSHEGHFINKVARVVPRHVKVTACPR